MKITPEFERYLLADSDTHLRLAFSSWLIARPEVTDYAEAIRGFMDDSRASVPLSEAWFTERPGAKS